MSRFPLRNKPLLEKWENIIRSENNDKEWQATSASRICSKHFSTCDYIVAPSKDSSCRIKKKCCAYNIFNNSFRQLWNFQDIPQKVGKSLSLTVINFNVIQRKSLT